MITKSTLSLMISVIRSTNNGMQHSVDTNVFPGNAALAVAAGAVPEQQLDYFVACLNGAMDLLTMRVPVENWNYYVGNNAESFYHYGLKYVAPAMYVQLQGGFNATEPKPFNGYYRQGCGISSTPEQEQQHHFGAWDFKQPRQPTRESGLGDALKSFKEHNGNEPRAVKEIIGVDRILANPMWYMPFFNELLNPGLSGLKPLDYNMLARNLLNTGADITTISAFDVTTSRAIAMLIGDLTATKGFPPIISYEHVGELYSKLDKILPDEYKGLLAKNAVRIITRMGIRHNEVDTRRIEMYDAITYGCLINNTDTQKVWEKTLGCTLPMSFTDFASQLSQVYTNNPLVFRPEDVSEYNYSHLHELNETTKTIRVYNNLSGIDSWDELLNIASMIVDPIKAIKGNALVGRLRKDDEGLRSMINGVLYGTYSVTAITNDEELLNFTNNNTYLNQFDFMPLECTARALGEIYALFGYNELVATVSENLANSARVVNSYGFVKLVKELYNITDISNDTLQQIEMTYLEMALDINSFTIINAGHDVLDMVSTYLSEINSKLNPGVLAAAVAEVMKES